MKSFLAAGIIRAAFYLSMASKYIFRVSAKFTISSDEGVIGWYRSRYLCLLLWRRVWCCRLQEEYRRKVFRVGGPTEESAKRSSTFKASAIYFLFGLKHYLHNINQFIF